MLFWTLLILLIPNTTVNCALRFKYTFSLSDIEGSKGNVAMNAWLPQPSYPCGNFSDTSSLKLLESKYRLDVEAKGSTVFRIPEDVYKTRGFYDV